jgi:hypothetical protein
LSFVKIDGDGQMDSSNIPNLIKPILHGETDYTKGNRFYTLNLVREMPKIRLIGNVVLSFMSKLSTGFYHIFDPNNGFTAVSSEALVLMELASIDDRYFFVNCYYICYNFHFLNLYHFDLVKCL